VAEAPQLVPVLLGLGRYYVVRAELDAAHEVARHLSSLAEATRVPAQRLAAENALGIAAFYAGDFDRALGHLERGIELYDTDQHRPARSPAFRFGQDPGVSCTVHAAMALWILGYPARAAARAEAAVSLARSLGDPFSLSYACHFAAGVHQWRGDRRTVKQLEDAALALDTEHGFGLFLTAGIIQRGWLSSDAAPDENAVARMRQGVAKHREIGAAVLVPAFLALVAEVHGKLGQPREALSSVDEALAAIEPSGQHYWKAELRRLRGALVLQADPGAAREAEACFLDALAIAQRQHAKSLELRAATSLGRLWAAEGRVDAAHAVLSRICDWFTEGLDTADVNEAKSLLAELDARRRQGPGARS
jgi:predicted ATPase